MQIACGNGEDLARSIGDRLVVLNDHERTLKHETLVREVMAMLAVYRFGLVDFGFDFGVAAGLELRRESARIDSCSPSHCD